MQRADPKYEFKDFAELVRKVPIDFDASITPFTEAELDQHVPTPAAQFCRHSQELQPIPGGPSPKHATLYWVDYATGPPRRSVLLYLKATVTGDETDDINNYRATHPEFPHEATGDQVFDEAHGKATDSWASTWLRR